jgi:hypothetical protein
MKNVLGNDVIFDAAWSISGWGVALKEKITEIARDDNLGRIRYTFFILGVRDLINSYLKDQGINYRDEITPDILNKVATYFERMGVLEDEFYNAFFLDQMVAYSIYNKISFDDMSQMIRAGKLTMDEIYRPIINPDTVDTDLL